MLQLYFLIRTVHIFFLSPFQRIWLFSKDGTYRLQAYCWVLPDFEIYKNGITQVWMEVALETKGQRLKVDRRRPLTKKLEMFALIQFIWMCSSCKTASHVTLYIFLDRDYNLIDFYISHRKKEKYFGRKYLLFSIKIRSLFDLV